MNPKRIVEQAKQTGRLWMGGEMEIPYPCRWSEAYQKMCDIAEQCGYIVHSKGTASMIFVSGGEIPGELVLDWFNPDNSGPIKVGLWTEQAAYFDA